MEGQEVQRLTASAYHTPASPPGAADPGDAQPAGLQRQHVWPEDQAAAVILVLLSSWPATWAPAHSCGLLRCMARRRLLYLPCLL